MDCARMKCALFAILLSCSVYMSLCSDEGSVNLTILHTNDVHSHIEETSKYGGTCWESDQKAGKCVGGVARIVTKVKELKQKYPEALFLNGGDFYQGTAYYTIFKHKVVSAIMTAMNYSHVCLGNHEFDDGPDGLAPFLDAMNESGIAVIGTNTNFSGEPALRDKPIHRRVTITVQGQKIGILGAVLPQTKQLSRPGRVEFEDEIESFRREAQALEKEDVKIIVAVTHCGYLRDLKIIEEVKELDLIVGGHTNTFLYHGSGYPAENKVEGDYPTVVNRSDGSQGLVVQAFCYGKFLGFLQVAFNNSGHIQGWSGNPILLSSSVAEDNATLEVIKPFKENVTKVMKQPVGHTKVVLEAYENICRLRECNLGNLMADAYFAYYADMNSSSEELWSDVNGALINGGSIRAQIQQGDITMGDILATVPFGQNVLTITLNGSDLRLMFEHSVGNFSYDNKKGEFLQVSGFRVVYNLSMPARCRVRSLKVLCTKCKVPAYEDVISNRNYTIVTTDFVVKGGDGFPKAKNYRESGPLDLTVLVEYIGKMSPIKTPIEGRITIHGNVTTPVTP